MAPLDIQFARIRLELPWFPSVVLPRLYQKTEVKISRGRGTQSPSASGSGGCRRGSSHTNSWSACIKDRRKTGGVVSVCIEVLNFGESTAVMMVRLYND